MYGYTTKLKTVREATNMLQYDISGIGSGSIMNERLVNFQKVASPESLLSSDPPHKISQCRQTTYIENYY